MVPIEHNIGAVPGAMAVDADGTVVADAGGAMVVDANGATVVNEDAMPIAAIDYKRPVSFVFEGLTSRSGHSAPRDVHRASPYLMVPKTTTVNNLAVHQIMERMGYSVGHALGMNHQGNANLI